MSSKKVKAKKGEKKRIQSKEGVPGERAALQRVTPWGSCGVTAKLNRALQLQEGLVTVIKDKMPF